MTWKGSPTPGGWEYTHDESGARIILDYLTPTFRGLEAWVELRLKGDDEIPLSQGQRNLMVAQAINPFLADVKDLELEVKVPWRSGLRLAFHETIEAWREGAVTIDLATVEPKGMQWILEPLLETGGNTRLIAPGGGGKSIFAMALALTIATGSAKFLGLAPAITGPVLYLDWETNQDTHAQRIKALCEPIGVTLGRDLIIYRNESIPLARSVQAVTRAVQQSGAVTLIVDSAKMAAGPSGQSSGEESTLSMYMALRAIGRPAAIVDHKSSEAILKGRLGGYGSVYNENLARMQWEYTYYSRRGDLRQWVLALTKENNVGELPPLGFLLETKGGKSGLTAARFEQANPEAIMSQAAGNDLADRIYTVLAAVDEPVEVSKLREMLGGDVKEATIRARLTRDHRFTNVAGKGGAGKWRLIDELLGAPRDDGFQSMLSEGPFQAPPEEADDEDMDNLDATPPSNFRVGPDTF